ncbi:MAG TPA: ABC-2 family transporter protein [Gemmataceae bacterium]|nr:ABC-2 family transporter protein [Gemmataceae bacterium]
MSEGDAAIQTGRGIGRYLRLLRAFARFGLLSEMAFRANFLAKVTVEILWLSLLLVFYHSVFRQTSSIGGWTQAHFLAFLGCYYALEGIIETFFLENCSEFGELIRTGNLDLYLLKPMDEQFLVTCRKIEWSTFPNVLLGVGVAITGLVQLDGWHFDLGWAALFVVLFLCGVAMAYSFLVILMATAVWLVRNQSLFELWWLFTTLMRYPRDIYVGRLASPLGFFFSFIVPVLLVVYVPARTLLQAVDDWRFVGITFLATVVLLWLSRRFFRRALQSYRSASS